MRLIAHRGGRGFGVDNTLEAMEKAVRSGVRWIETDVRRTADDRLLICHDAVIWNHIVSRSNYAELSRHAPERPLFQALLETLAGWVNFNIEVKEAPPEAVGEMIEAYRIEKTVLVTSFQREFIVEFKKLFPAVQLGLLYRMPYGGERKLFSAAEAGAEIVLPHFHSIDKELVHNAHRLGLQIYGWTVNNHDDLDRLVDWGVDGIITDKYLDFKQKLGRQAGLASPP